MRERSLHMEILFETAFSYLFKIESQCFNIYHFLFFPHVVLLLKLPYQTDFSQNLKYYSGIIKFTIQTIPRL